MVKIGDVEIRGRVTLAPMAGVTDFAFRSICTELGAALTTTEMVSAKALCYGDKKRAAFCITSPAAVRLPRKFSGMNRNSWPRQRPWRSSIPARIYWI